jgi:hypothetical protein
MLGFNYMESTKPQAPRKTESAGMHWLVRWHKSILLAISATAMVAGVLIESGGLLIFIGFIFGIVWVLEVQKKFYVEPSESAEKKHWWQYRRAEKKGLGYYELVGFLGIVAFLLLASSGILKGMFWLLGFVLGGISRLLY